MNPLRILFLVFGFGLLFYVPSSQGQRSLDTTRVYKVNPWISTGIGTVGVITNVFGIQRLLSKEDTPLEDILALTEDNVPKFDRWALRQDIEKSEQAHKISTAVMSGAFALPLLLGFDKKARKHWLDLAPLYFETQAISANLYSYGPFGPTFIDRFRPIAYYEDVALEERTSGRRRNSFFSGHVSTTATGTFFLAKVLDDYHPELGSKKWLLYGAALLPALVTGYYRMAHLVHFPSDILAGTLVGAATGILVPHFHKRNKGKTKLSLIYETDAKGIVLLQKF